MNKIAKRIAAAVAGTAFAANLLLQNPGGFAFAQTTEPEPEGTTTVELTDPKHAEQIEAQKASSLYAYALGSVVELHFKISTTYNRIAAAALNGMAYAVAAADFRDPVTGKFTDAVKINPKTKKITAIDFGDRLVNVQSVVLAQSFETQAEYLIQYATKEFEGTTLTVSELMVGAINGALMEFDPHTVYFPQKEKVEDDNRINNVLSGIGIEFQSGPSGLPVVTHVYPGSPASKAGFHSGDLIKAVSSDGTVTDTKGLNTFVVRNMLRGAEGTSVTLNLERNSQNLEVEVTRSPYKVPSVKSRMLSPGIGEIEIDIFNKYTATEFYYAAEELKKEALESGSPLKGLALNLTSNPGGVYISAVEILKMLINDKNVKFLSVGRDPKSGTEFRTNGKDILKNVKIAVLTNYETASAAEIIPAVLQDVGRATIFSTGGTFGKGTTQAILRLTSIKGSEPQPAGGLAITDGMFYPPSGTTQYNGVFGDILVKSHDGRTEDRPTYLQEKNQWRAIKPDQSLARPATPPKAVCELKAEWRGVLNEEQYAKIPEKYRKYRLELNSNGQVEGNDRFDTILACAEASLAAETGKPPSGSFFVKTTKESKYPEIATAQKNALTLKR